MRALVGCLAWLPLLAFAQQADPVVVTATRVGQPSLEVPASIDRLYGEELREGRAQVNLSESLGRVPGIVVLNRQNYAQDLQISSRGFGARASFGVRGIRLIADGVPATMPDGQGQAATFDLGSASRVEVLRGPFSALYGNASGGVINVITEDAPPVPTLEGGFYAGDYDTWRGAVKFGWQRDNVGYLVSASRFESDGYREHSAVRRDQLNTGLKVDLGGGTRLSLSGMTLQQPDTQDPLGLNATQVAQNPRQVAANALLFNTRKSIEHDQVGATLEHPFSASTRLQASAWGGTRDVEQFLAIPTVNQNAITHSGGVVSLDRVFGGAGLRVSSEASLASKPLRWTLGMEYERMAERRRGYMNNNGEQGALKRDEDNVVASTGFFGQAEWKFAERWSAHLGLRASRVEFESTDFFVTADPLNGDDSGAKSFHATTPVAGMVFRLDPKTSLYANYGRGFETPTFVELAYQNQPASGLNFALEPSRSRHVEAGVKAFLKGGVRLNAALFDIETRDEIVVDQSSGGRATFKNAGRTQRRGFELGAEGQWGAFESRLAYTEIEASFRDGFDTVVGAPPAPISVPAGNSLPGVPKVQAYGEVAWRHAPTGFRAALEVLHRSKVAVNDANSEFAGAFTIANLVLGLQQQGTRWRLSEFLRIDNLSDKSYVGSVVVNDGNGRYYEPAPQRNILLGVQARLQF